VSGRFPISPSPSGQLNKIRDLLSISDDVEGETYNSVETYDSVDGCTSSRMARGKDDTFEEPTEYASTDIVRQVAVQTLPRIRDLPSHGDGLYSVATGDEESHDPIDDGVYSEMDNERPPQPLPQDLQSDDVYSVVDEPKCRVEHKPAIRKKPTKRQAEDKYSVVNSSAQQQQQPEDLYSIVNKPPATATQQKQQQQQPEDIYSVVNKPGATATQQKQQQQKNPEDIYSIVNKPSVKKKPVRSQTQQHQQQPTQDIYSAVNKSPARAEKHPEDMYSVVNKPANPEGTTPEVEELYSVVQKPTKPPPTVKPKPSKPSSEELYSVVDKTRGPVSTSSLSGVMAETRWVTNDLYAEVTPKKLPQGGIQNGDIYSVVDKTKAPPPVAKKPLSRSRFASDKSDTQEDTVSRDSRVAEEEEPSIPERLYDDDDTSELEPPPLPPRLYSLSDFESEDEQCFDDIMSADEDLSGGGDAACRTFSNPIYESASSLHAAQLAAAQRDQKREEGNPLYQTMAELRKEVMSPLIVY